MAVILTLYGVTAAGCDAGATNGRPQPDAAAAEPVETGSRLVAQQLPSVAPRLRALKGGRTDLVDTGRNPFRMGLAAAAPAATAPAPAAVAAPVVAPAATHETEPAVELRLLGLVETPGNGGRVLVVSDGAGTHHGRVGDVVAGRYRLAALNGTVVTVEDLARGALHRLRFGGS